jgi:hypothetical protein
VIKAAEAFIKSKIRAAAKKHGVEISQKVADFADENEICGNDGGTYRVR